MSIGIEIIMFLVGLGLTYYGAWCCNKTPQPFVVLYSVFIAIGICSMLFFGIRLVSSLLYLAKDSINSLT
jgi:hypothetical protein